MSRSLRLGAALVALLLLSPGHSTAHGPGTIAVPPSGLATPIVSGDGLFVGAPGISGAIDLDAWSLVSDIAAGQPPRLVPAGDATEAPATSWAALGSDGGGDGALKGTVNALALIGATLYVGGDFTDAAGIGAADYIAGWDGATWFALGDDQGDGALKAPVRALTVRSGELFAGGDFIDAAGIPEADYVARWNGSIWSSLESPDVTTAALNGPVFALARRGSDIHLGGEFTNAAGLAAADHVVRWQSGSASWHAMGGGAAGALNGGVRAILTFGSDVIVGGSFTNAAGLPTADRIASWNFWSNAWSSMDASGGADGALNGEVLTLAGTYSAGEIYVGGAFTNAAGIPAADYLARWKAGSWAALGSNGAGDGALNGAVRALAISDELFVGGAFADAGGVANADHLARWTIDGWAPIGGSNAPLGSPVNALVARPTKTLFVGGSFSDAGGMVHADRVASTNIGGWHALGSNGAGDGIFFDGQGVFAMAVMGGDLYIGGSFTNAAGILTADRIARWDGSSWHALGSNGAGNGAINGERVSALAVMGNRLIVGGVFTVQGLSPTVNHLAQWDGSSWSAVGALSGDARLVAGIGSLAVSGNDLFVSGGFTDLAGIPAADSIARWDGTSWWSLGSTPPLNLSAQAMASDGANLYVGGAFTNAAGIPEADYVARWNGSSWSALGSNGLGDGALTGIVRAIALAGSDIYVGGEFLNAAGNPDADRIARWNGASWSALGPGGSAGIVRAIAVRGDHLYVGGSGNDWAGIEEADAIARWDGARWSALGSNGAGNGAMMRLTVTHTVRALLADSNDLFVGGSFKDGGGVTEADYVAAWGPIAGPVSPPPPPTFARRPDGRIRKGTGAYVGNNIYDALAGTSQTRTGSAARGRTITFYVSIQNDGQAKDRFRVAATGVSVAGYRIRYFRGTTEITAAVVAGTYLTPSLAPGSAHVIKAKVMLKAAAAKGTSVSRLVTSTSLADAGQVDGVKFIGKRR